MVPFDKVNRGPDADSMAGITKHLPRGRLHAWLWIADILESISCWTLNYSHVLLLLKSTWATFCTICK